MSNDRRAREISARAPTVGERLLRLQQLFSRWSEHGVPTGVEYPTSMLQLLEWTDQEHGIHHPIGSKRDLNTKSGRHHKIAGKVADLISQLRLAPAEKPLKRVYKTQKARRIAAEDTLEKYQGLLNDVSKQWAERGAELESVRSSV